MLLVILFGGELNVGEFPLIFCIEGNDEDRENILLKGFPCDLRGSRMDITIVLLIGLCFLLLISPYRYILTLFINRDKSMAYKIALLIGLAVISILFIAGIESLTIEPHVTSGNGNLALLLIIPFLMVLTIYLMALFLFAKEFLNPRWKPLVIGLVMAVITLSIARIWQNSSELISLLGGTPDEPESRIFRFPWLNQYTNTLFFNGYLLLFLTGLTILGSTVFTSAEKPES
ncbi:MAG TPA: hypothetical protein DCR24_03120 [Bacillus bacterium]|nr:hypothetical protein [Bacillus sp. (in: firmicutes)]